MSAIELSLIEEIAHHLREALRLNEGAEVIPKMAKQNIGGALIRLNTDIVRIQVGKLPKARYGTGYRAKAKRP